MFDSTEGMMLDRSAIRRALFRVQGMPMHTVTDPNHMSYTTTGYMDAHLNTAAPIGRADMVAPAGATLSVSRGIGQALHAANDNSPSRLP